MNRFNLTPNDRPFGASSNPFECRPGDAFAGRRPGSRPSVAKAAAELRDERCEEPRNDEPRWDLIRRLRREIAAGTYASPERWHRALTGLDGELAG